MSLKIEYLPLAAFRRYGKNARTHSDDQLEQIANSIREYGFTNPVLVDEDNELIAGHGRLSAAELLAMDTVPAIRLVGLTPTQKKALRIADNQLALNAGWDEALLAIEVQELSGADYDLELLGFTDEQLDDLLSPADDEGAEPAPDDPVVRIKYLSIDKDRVPATDEEIAELLDVFRKYHDSHGSHEGFVGWLAEGR
uniref:ParB domain protein nuclease n=1 Tax=Serratia proteamaculans (strain 568) TaxID=399741 RepID=A8GLM6_SERP5